MTQLVEGLETIGGGFGPYDAGHGIGAFIRSVGQALVDYPADMAAY